jgi:hypothetical protein
VVGIVIVIGTVIEKGIIEIEGIEIEMMTGIRIES